MNLPQLIFCALGLVLTLPSPQIPAEKVRIDAPKVIEAFFAADPWTPEGRAERARLLTELEKLPPLAESDVDKWRSACPGGDVCTSSTPACSKTHPCDGRTQSGSARFATAPATDDANDPPETRVCGFPCP
ncbi:MAG: hypothetical protein IPK67_16005 [Planctomycetes bacterium]|nr:hypothetical protein [Planctomycetota bacterium]